MQQLAKTIIESVDEESLQETTPSIPGSAELRVAACRWARFCLMNLRDDLLKKGLAVSASIADFLSENEKPGNEICL